MTIVVTIRVNDGIVLAADSATSFFNDQGFAQKVYNNANKIFNLVKLWPIGAMTYGSGSIGDASISTISKDFRDILDPETSNDKTYKLDPKSYTIEEVAIKAKRYLFEDRYKDEYDKPIPNFSLGYRICGFSSEAGLPEAWEIRIIEDRCEGPDQLYDEKAFGPRWAGETEALDRLVMGLGSRTAEALCELGLEEKSAAETVLRLTEKLYAQLYLPAMPIQDAIDLGKFLVDTAANYSHFSLRPATVGGPIEVATITKHEGFRWIHRKHYYSAEFNRGA